MTEEEIEAPQRATEEVRCHCVLIQVRGEEETRCNMITTGPDDPFCEECTTRHTTHPGVVTGYLKVEARMREKEESHG